MKKTNNMSVDKAFNIAIKYVPLEKQAKFREEWEKEFNTTITPTGNEGYVYVGQLRDFVNKKIQQ